MTALSPAALLAWKIASYEALIARSEFIGKEHLLIGLCSLEKVLLLKDFKRQPGACAGMLKEKDALDLMLHHSGMEGAGLRRRLRRSLPAGAVSRRKGTIIHRSPECRECFDRAQTLAQGKPITCIHLFDAILEDPGPLILRAIDGLFPEGSPGKGQAHPGLARITNSAQEYQVASKQKEDLSREIEQSRHSLSTVPRQSDRFLKMKRELHRKTLDLAFLCLKTNDIPGMIAAFRELAPDAGGDRRALDEIVLQLAYMQEEEIRIGDRSVEKIRDLLKRIGAGTEQG